jgi:hypothetical protein
LLEAHHYVEWDLHVHFQVQAGDVVVDLHCVQEAKCCLLPDLVVGDVQLLQVSSVLAVLLGPRAC